MFIIDDKGSSRCWLLLTSFVPNQDSKWQQLHQFVHFTTSCVCHRFCQNCESLVAISLLLCTCIFVIIHLLVKNVSIITVLAIIICPNYTSPLILEKLSLCGVLVIKEAPPSFKHGIILCWETMIVDHVYHIWINKMLAILHYNSCLCRNVSFHQNVHLHDKICDKIRYVTPTESVHWFLKFF